MSNKSRLYQYASKGNWSSQSDKAEVLNGIENLQSEVDGLQARITGWISVDDALPPKCDHVLCIKKDGRILVSWRCYDERQSGNSAYFYHESKLYSGGLITHWMPLPEPPVDTVTG